MREGTVTSSLVLRVLHFPGRFSPPSEEEVWRCLKRIWNPSTFSQGFRSLFTKPSSSWLERLSKRHEIFSEQSSPQSIFIAGGFSSGGFMRLFEPPLNWCTLIICGSPFACWLLHLYYTAQLGIHLTFKGSTCAIQRENSHLSFKPYLVLLQSE